MYRHLPYAERKVLPFFPRAPEGALIFSRCIAYHILAGNRSVRASKIILFDNEYARSVDPFGANLGKLMEVLPHDGFSVDHLIEHGTLFGFYSESLSPERKRLWRQNQLSGDARLINKFVTGNSGQKIRLIKEHLHFCKMCRHNDELAYGIAHWRTVHQLPSVLHCPVHLIPLSGACAKCGLPIAFEDSWEPPSEACPHCGSLAFFEKEMPRSALHLRFVELCNSATRGIPVGLARADRDQLYSHFYKEAGQSIDQCIENLIEVLLRRWEVNSLEQLQSLLHVVVNHKFLTQAITSQDTIQSPGGHLAVIAALEAEGYTFNKLNNPSANIPRHENTLTKVLSDECRATLEELVCNARALIKVIERVCDSQGLPAQIGVMLINGSQVDATRKFRVDQYRGARLLVALDEIDFIAEGIISVSNPKKSEFSFSYLRNAMKWHKVRNAHRASIREFLFNEHLSLSTPQETVLRSVIWIGKHDQTWLGALYDADDPLSEKVRMACRKSIVGAIKAGCRIPSAVRHNTPIAFVLCQLFDAYWLNSTIPPTKYEGLSFEDKRARCRRMITVAIEAGVTHRGNMPKRAKRWCLENDREWLDRTVPCQWSNGKPSKKT